MTTMATMAASLCDALFERVGKNGGDVEPALLRNFHKAGRARYVDLGEAIADDVQADQQQAPLVEQRAQRLGNLPIPVRQRLRAARTPRRQVAARLPGLGDTRQRVGNGLTG